MQVDRVHGFPGTQCTRRWSALARALIEKRGHLEQRDLESFAVAGFSPAQVLETIAGLAVSVMANYAGNITKPPLEEPFKAQAWSV